MIDLNTQFADLDYLLLRSGNIAPETFAPGQFMKDALFNQVRVLVIGAGGLGCEILKNLALTGFQDITIIDMDTIDITNLNRQFLFRGKDVGKYKSEIAAQFLRDRFPNIKISAHICKIQDFGIDFYSSFSIIIAGLDNIEARRWLNATLHDMVEFNEDSSPVIQTVKPFIDGGSEGFRGQARVIMPFVSGCFECSLSSLPQQKTYPMCTLAETPRVPEHCIEYAYVKLWNEEFKLPVNKDSPEDMTWIYEKALERAKTYGIEGVTYMLTLGVVKNVIPAIASTNALISAACVNEALKIGFGCSIALDNYSMYMGQTGINIQTFKYEKNETDAQFQLKNPAIRVKSTGDILYIPKPKNLEEEHHYKLVKNMTELVAEGCILNEDQWIVTDQMIPGTLNILISIKNN